jgi:hypothetical protein
MSAALFWSGGKDARGRHQDRTEQESVPEQEGVGAKLLRTQQRVVPRVSAPLQDSSEDDGFADFSPAATGRCLINRLSFSTSNDSCYAAEASRTAATSSEYRFLRPSMNTSSGLSGSGFAPGMP